MIFRKAKLSDYEGIYGIWMQLHVNPFMTFEILSKNEFLPIFKQILAQSDVYVLEDNEKHKIAAVRRIIPRTGEHAHTVEFASFGVSQDYLKKGYGILFYKYLIRELKHRTPAVTRIELIQETDNFIAESLAKKMRFHAEATFPDWILRETGDEIYRAKWRVGARYMAKLISPLRSQKTVSVFAPQLPVLQVFSDTDLFFKEKKNEIEYYYQNNRIAICQTQDGSLRLSHIQFWEFIICSDITFEQLNYFLRYLACCAAQNFKVVALFTANKIIMDSAKAMGFFCRGIKRASRKINDIYYDELALDCEFFNINDANIILQKITDVKIKNKFKNIILNCQIEILLAYQQAKIDNYGVYYLENLAFQILREQFSETQLYDQQSAPWSNLIHALPNYLQSSFSRFIDNY